MDRNKCVELLFEQGAVLKRTLPHLYAVRGHVDKSPELLTAEAKEHARKLLDLGYTPRPKRRHLVDDVVPTVAPYRDLSEIALAAIAGDPMAIADIRDAREMFGEACEEMGLPATATNAAHAYLVRQLHRLADDEWALGILDGPASRLVKSPTLLAKRAWDYRIDRASGNRVDRWGKRLAARRRRQSTAT